jgi:O-antigen chain-terminating methyltransferase
MASEAKDNLAAQSALKPDVAAIMEGIRARVRAELEEQKDEKLPFRRREADANGPNASRKAGDLISSEELRYLNANHAYSYKLDLDWIKSHRSGIIGKLIVKAKRTAVSLVWNYFIKHYYAREREYNVNLVRFLNETCHYVDARDASIFWELIRKIDVDITRVLERIERVGDDQMAALRSAEKALYEALHKLALRQDEVSVQAREQAQEIKTLQIVAQGLESIVARMGQPKRQLAAAAGQSVAPDYSYLLFEDRFRGSKAEISARLSVYPEIFKGLDGAVLDLGAGRGELLALFKQARIAAYGVELDSGMVEAGQASGLDIRQANGLTHLAELADASLGGVVAIQVLEHLHFDQIKTLLDLCLRKVKRGGKVAFETINPQSVLALSSQYCRDPTHVAPLHPDTLAYAMTLAGLRVLETKMLSPVPVEAKLQPIPVEEFVTPRWALLIKRFNSNLEALNQMLYGDQDYCVVAEVP